MQGIAADDADAAEAMQRLASAAADPAAQAEHLQAKLAEARANADRPDLRRFLGVDGDLGVQLGLPADAKVISFVGWVRSYKGVWELYEAFTTLDCAMLEINPLIVTEEGDLFAIDGKVNFVFLGGVVATIAICGYVKPPIGVQETSMLFMAFLSLWVTQKDLRKDNGFSWEPIVEVAVVFAGIFATMIPALAILNARGAALGLTEPRGGSDAANLALSARRVGDSYVLRGEKSSISMADQADAIVLSRAFWL